jgi:hypothetical protein
MNQQTPNKIEVRLRITYQEYLQYYQGAVKAVVTRDIHGRTVQFPAHVLRTFVGHDGIRGSFTIYTDEHNRFIKIERND